jgi:hypothetical protein
MAITDQGNALLLNHFTNELVELIKGYAGPLGGPTIKRELLRVAITGKESEIIKSFLDELLALLETYAALGMKEETAIRELLLIANSIES